MTKTQKGEAVVGAAAGPLADPEKGERTNEREKLVEGIWCARDKIFAALRQLAWIEQQAWIEEEAGPSWACEMLAALKKEFGNLYWGDIAV
jgi:hypothetical protein